MRNAHEFKHGLEAGVTVGAVKRDADQTAEDELADSGGHAGIHLALLRHERETGAALKVGAEKNLPAHRLHRAQQRLDERALALAIRTEQRPKLAPPDGQVHVGKHHATAIGERDLLRAQHGLLLGGRRRGDGRDAG